MAFTDKGDRNEEIEQTNDNDTKNQSPLDTPTTLQSSGKPARGFLDMFNVLSNRIYLLKFYSASAKFRRIAEQRDSTSRSVGSSSSGSHAFKERLTGVFAKKIDWVSLVKMSKEWIRNPINMALFAWITIVAISGAILFLVMTGMLNKAIPKKSQRDVWFEVNNQILNALFTLMCLYQHPKRFYHLTLLCRWNEKDIAKLRKIYCKNGTYKPHEWAHMLVVVILLHLNCFAQYALCGLNLGYRRSGRPAIGVGICISVAIAAPAFAGLYTIISPLGKDYESRPDDEEAQIPIADGTKRSYSLEKRYSFASRHEQGLIEEQPQWSGGILDIWDNISLSYLSLFCTFCVFGWNMERLGFGNMYVHIATFILFCMAPFWIFNLAAVNIDNEVVREALAIVGIILCGFGLLYGGFWRIQMRKRFNLPSYNFCFGRPAVSDCALWLCCCWCTLAQEVRTGNAYEVIEDKLLKKQTDNGDHPLLSPLSREDGVVPLTSTTGNSSTERMISRPDSLPKEYSSPGREVNDESLVSGNDDTMSPPVPSLVEK